jgi:hypothetical protein
MRPLGMGSPQGGLRKLGLMTRGVPGTGVVAAAGPTLADIQAIVNAQTFGGIWLAQGGAYSDAGTTLAADGGTVQQLNDRSSFANHLAQASAGFRPTYQASDGGYPSLIANGFKALRKTFSGMTVSKPYYNIVAWRPITHTNNYQIVTCDSVTADRALLLGRLTSGTYGIFDGTLACDNTIADGTEVVTTSIHNGASSSLQVDNAAAVTGNAGANAAPTGNAWFNDSSNGSGCNLAIRGQILVPTSISAPQLATIKTFLGSLAGRSI